jgi:hypothetical protein
LHVLSVSLYDFLLHIFDGATLLVEGGQKKSWNGKLDVHDYTTE